MKFKNLLNERIKTAKERQLEKELERHASKKEEYGVAIGDDKEVTKGKPESVQIKIKPGAEYVGHTHPKPKENQITMPSMADLQNAFLGVDTKFDKIIKSNGKSKILVWNKAGEPVHLTLSPPKKDINTRTRKIKNIEDIESFNKNGGEIYLGDKRVKTTEEYKKLLGY